MSNLCNNNKNLPIKFTVVCYTNKGEEPVYGSVVTTTRAIEMLPENKRTLDLLTDKGKFGGTITFNLFNMDMRPSLIDYLQQGWHMRVSIGVDFTLSDLEITDYRSLHRKTQGEMNQYEKALFEVCNVMTPYALGKFNVYGFGGVPKYLNA